MALYQFIQRRALKFNEDEEIENRKNSQKQRD